MNKKIYYNQADSRWSNHKYPSQELPNATIKSGGCGATASAMIISSLTNNTIYPDTLGDIFVQKGIRVNGGTDVNKAAKYIAENYGLEYKKVNSDDELINYIANGYVALVSVKGGSVFSTGGHIVFICGYANGLIQVYDPYLYTNKFNSYGRNGKVTLAGNDIWISNENWKAYAKSNVKYVFKIPEDKITVKYQNGQKVLLDIPVIVTGNRVGDGVIQVNSNGYYFFVHESVVKNNKVYGLATICCPISEDTYIVQVFEGKIGTQFNCKSEYMSDKF